jgi:glutamate:GABA antiporter
MSKPRQVLGTFTLSMISVAAIVSLKNLPFAAEYGFGAIFLYFVAAILFFVPTAFVAAELATGWPASGGIYIWVKAGFGNRIGFLAIWLQWVQNIVWYPGVLSFTAGAIAYIVNPQLIHNKYYVLSVVLVTYWAMTFVNFFGMRISGFISSFGAIVGTLIPGALIIILAAIWPFSGHHVQIAFNWHTALPDMTQFKNIVFFVGVVLALSGMELSAVHASEVKNPQRAYPRAIFLAAIIIILISSLGTLAIAMVVPASQISLVAGVMQAFKSFFIAYHMAFLIPWIAGALTIGAIAMIATWIIGPSKGLLASAHEGDIPSYLQKQNKHDVPVRLLVLQGILSSCVALIFLLMPSVNASFWVITDVSTQIYMLMYLLMFAAAIYLRYKKPDQPRAYRVPFGNLGMWIISGLGFLGSLFVLVIGFIPPAQIHTGDIVYYEGFMILGMVVLIAFPLIAFSFRNPAWTNKSITP